MACYIHIAETALGQQDALDRLAPHLASVGATLGAHEQYTGYRRYEIAGPTIPPEALLVELIIDMAPMPGDETKTDPRCFGVRVLAS